MAKYREVNSLERESLYNLHVRINDLVDFRRGKSFFQVENTKSSGTNACSRFEATLNKFNLTLSNFVQGKRGVPSKEDISDFKSKCDTFYNPLMAGKVKIYDGTKDVLEVYKNLFDGLYKNITEYCEEYNVGVNNGRKH